MTKDAPAAIAPEPASEAEQVSPSPKDKTKLVSEAKKPRWWQVPGILAASIAVLAAAGSAIIFIIGYFATRSEFEKFRCDAQVLIKINQLRTGTMSDTQLYFDISRQGRALAAKTTRTEYETAQLEKLRDQATTIRRRRDKDLDLLKLLEESFVASSHWDGGSCIDVATGRR